MTLLGELTSRYDISRTAFLSRVGEAQAVNDQYQRVEQQRVDAVALEQTCAQVAALLSSYSEQEQRDLQGRIEGLVTQGLQAVFGETMAFKMTPDTERGQATLRFTISSDDAGDTDVLQARGGGLAAVVGFLLRVVVVSLHPDQPRRFFVLDETFGMVSSGFQEELGRFIRQLCDEAGLQVLLVTHAPRVGLAADKVYDVSHDGSRTVLRPMEAVEL